MSLALSPDHAKTSSGSVGELAGPSSLEPPRPPRKIIALVAFLWKWLLGAVSCQAFPLALVGAGWAYRAARRSALKTWWKQSQLSDRSPKETFATFAAAQPELADDATMPNWIIRQRFRQRVRHSEASFPFMAFSLVHSLISHFWLGARAWLHSMVFLALPSSLMMFSWYAGWDNSFNKSYEQFDVGAILGWVGIVLFILVMLYLPLAQARFAITGQSRTFYQFRLVRRVIRRRWCSCLFLIGGYATAGIPLMMAGGFLGVATAAQDGTKPNRFADYTPEQAIQFLETYYFFWGFYVFAAFLALRCWGARIYARGVVTCLQTGRWKSEALSPREANAVEALALNQKNTERSPKRRVLWLGNTGARILIGGTAAIVLWFSIAAQSYVTQFFAFQPEIKRWLNHPLIQVPWFHHIPKHLKEK